jgi:hypothetical protein
MRNFWQPFIYNFTSNYSGLSTDYTDFTDEELIICVICVICG